MDPHGRLSGSLHILVDIGLAAVLGMALAAVFGLDLLTRRPPPEPEESEIKLVETKEEPAEPENQQPAKKLTLGVTPDRPQFDDMGRLLDTLGEGYRYQSFPMDGLTDPEKLSQFDVVFLTCAGIPDSWVGQIQGAADRPGFQTVSINPEIENRLRESLRKFVSKGGTLYVSDLHFGLMELAFPEYIDRPKVNSCRSMESLAAEVLDQGLAELLGQQMTLRLESDGWRPAAFAGKDVTTILRGTYDLMSGGQGSGPLLVKFPVQEGTVIFTSFHNASQNNESELKLLRYLVFSAVTADVERRVTKTLLQGGFQKAKQSLFSASASERAVTQTHHCEKAGQLQFVLGFDNLGAKLRFTVVGPDGKKYEKEGTSTIVIDATADGPGDWKYTVTALELPNENFAYTLTIGQK